MFHVKHFVPNNFWRTIIMNENKERNTHKYIKNLVLAAMFLAIGLLLPFLTGQLKNLGSMLLPMHIPVLLCGLICGWQYGAAVGAILPLLRNLLFGMPPMPGAISMAFELCTYGLVIGLMYGLSKWKCIISLYRSMIVAMLAGRAVWGIAQYIILGIKGGSFGFEAFMAGAFLNAIPGIILQLIFIPVMMVALDRTGLVRFTKSKAKCAAKAE